jgi:hypothetical protein
MAELIQRTAWYNKPVLLNLLSLCRLCLSPQHASQNGLSMIALSLILTPALMRPRDRPYGECFLLIVIIVVYSCHYRYVLYLRPVRRRA